MAVVFVTLVFSGSFSHSSKAFEVKDYQIVVQNLEKFYSSSLVIRLLPSFAGISFQKTKKSKICSVCTTGFCATFYFSSTYIIDFCKRTKY